MTEAHESTMLPRYIEQAGCHKTILAPMCLCYISCAKPTAHLPVFLNAIESVVPDNPWVRQANKRREREPYRRGYPSGVNKAPAVGLSPPSPPRSPPFRHVAARGRAVPPPVRSSSSSSIVGGSWDSRSGQSDSKRLAREEESRRRN